MATIPLTGGGFTIMREGIQVLRIYGIEYKETFGNLIIYLINAQGETMRETFRFKTANGSTNEPAMNAFSFFAKTAMDNFSLTDIDPEDLVNHYIRCEVIHNESNGRTFANLGRDKSAAYKFEDPATPEALTKTLTPKAPEPEKLPSSDDLEAMLGA